MNADHKILIVDDDELAAAVPALALADLFQVTTAASGEEALSQLEALQPDVILLDIKMPGLDGYETCRRLREALPASAQPAVIFLSALESLEDRLQAYESGGDDFLIKPVAPEEIAQKVRTALGLVGERKRLQAEHASVQEMAMGFLANLGEAGTALNFLRNAPSCPSPQALAQMALATLSEYDLEGAVQCRMPWGCETYNVHGQASPLEESVFAKTIHLDRIFQFSSRMVVNYPHASLLVKNLPIGDEDRCGRLRDHLAIVAEGCENNLLALINKGEVEHRTHQLEAAAAAMERAINTLRRQYRDQQAETRIMLQQLNEQLAKQLLHYGLSDNQEAHLNAQLDDAMDRALGLFERGLDFDAQLGELLAGIRSTGVNGSGTP